MRKLHFVLAVNLVVSSLLLANQFPTLPPIPLQPPPIYLNDGNSHTVDSSYDSRSTIRLDYTNGNNQGTHAILNSETQVLNISAHGYSKIDMTDGKIGSITLEDNSKAVITGGSFSTLSVRNNAEVIVTGGGSETIGSSILALPVSRFNVRDNAIIYLNGSNFQITDSNGKTTQLKYGDKVSDYARCNGIPFTWLSRIDINTGLKVEVPIYRFNLNRISGILTDGTQLDTYCEIFNMGDFAGTADIMIIPEPCSLALLGIGGAMLLRKRNS